MCCNITWKNRFSHDASKTFIFDALIRGKAGFFMTRPKPKCTFDAFFVAGFLTKNSYICCIITWKSRFSLEAPKRCKFAALLRGIAGFPMTHQKLLYLMHEYCESRFSHEATENKVYI